MAQPRSLDLWAVCDIYQLDSDANLTLKNLTVANGRASGDFGGGIFNFVGTVTISNSTFVGNSANLGGGAIFNELAGDVVTLKNTIVANSPSGGNCSGSGAITNGGGNLSWPDTT